MAKNIAVYGIYPNCTMAEKAVEELKLSGFRNTDISVLFPESGGNKEFAIQKETKAPEGATTGAGAGAVVGGTLGWLTGIGLLAIPGIGPFIAAGPIMAALAGIGAGGLIGGLTGALVGMGIPEYEANRFEGRVKDGGILLSLHADDNEWKNKGRDILKRTGAEDIGIKGEAKADYEVSDRPYPEEADHVQRTEDDPVERRRGGPFQHDIEDIEAGARASDPATTRESNVWRDHQP